MRHSRVSPAQAPGNGHDRIVLRSGPLTTTLLLSPESRIASKTEAAAGREAVWEYAYDGHGRLVRAVLDGRPVEEYRYGARGERVADQCACRGRAWRPLSYASDGRLQRAGDRAYLFDSRGRLGAVRESMRSGRAMHLIYSPNGGLAEAHLANGLVVSQRTGLGGRPLEKLVNGRPTERFQWLDMTRLGQWRDLRGDVVMQFAYSKGRAPVAVRVRTAEGEAEYSLGSDQTGTIKAVADAHGHLIQHIQYDSFGNVLANTNPAFRLPLGFAGGLADRDTGLVRFGYRDYDPSIGRFTAPDPLGDTGGDHDPWEYCVDDPVNAVDPEGLRDKNVEAIEKADKVLDAVDALEKIRGVAGFTDALIEAGNVKEQLDKAWEQSIPGSNTSEWDWKDLDSNAANRQRKYYNENVKDVLKNGADIAQ